MPSDVFVISSVRDPSAAGAIRQAVELAGLSGARVQDAVFGPVGAAPLPDLDAIAREAGLTCPVIGVSSSLRALFFSAQSILAEDADLVITIGLHPETCAAFVLASPETVGRLNLLPRARLAARSLTGPERALRLEGLTSHDISIARTGQFGALLLSELLDELEAQAARWATVTVAGATLLVERI